MADLTNQDFGYYDNIRQNSNATGYPGNIDVFVDPKTGESIGICHIYGILWIDGDPIAINSAGAALLAIHHFNTGNGTIAPDLNGINSRCPVRLTAEFEETLGLESEALKSLAAVVGSSNGEDSRLPCAVLGATRSASTRPTAILSSSYNLPQMSFESSSAELSDDFMYPLFSRVIPTDNSLAKKAVDYLANELNVKHCIVLHVDDAYGVAYLREFSEEARENDLNIVAVHFPPFSGEEDMRKAISTVKDTECRCIFGIFLPFDLDFVLREAARQNIVGNDYFWLIGGGVRFNERTVNEGSLLDRAYKGIGFLQISPGREGSRGFDAFLKEWENLDSTAKTYFAGLIPNATVDDFNVEDSRRWPLAAYDTVVAMGLAACNATNNGDYFSGVEMHKSILNTVFHGASGFVELDSDSRSRILTTLSGELINVRRKDVKDGKVRFETVLSLAYDPNDEGSEWERVEFEPFIYADGSATRPPELPAINGGDGMNYNYIGNLRILAYVLFCLVAIMSVSFGAWTVVKRKSRVVKASQPIFLEMISAGVLIMASTMITLSIDDQYFSQEICNFACMANPWFIFMGFTISISALFSKTWRINRVLNNPNRFKRVKVEVKDVMAPFALFLVANIIILICWTIFAPLEFVRTVNKNGVDRFGRPISSFGKCTTAQETRSSATPFSTSLIVLNFLIVSFTAYQAYRARNISTDYSESKYIAMCIASQFQALIMGVPIVILLRQNEESHRTTFVVGSLIVFILSVVILLLMFIPKMLHHRMDEQEKKRKEQQKDGHQINPVLKTANEHSNETNLVESGHGVEEASDVNDGLRFHVNKKLVFDAVADNDDEHRALNEGSTDGRNS